MIEYRRRRRIDGRVQWVNHPIYESAEEAIEAGIGPIVPWRDLMPGDAPCWAEDDLGFVSQVRKVSTFQRKKDNQGGKQVTFPFGRRFVTKQVWGFGKHKEQDGWDRELRQGRTKRFVRAYAKLLFEYGREGITPDMLHDLGLLHRKDDKRPLSRAKWLLKQRRVQTMVKHELARIMEDAGWTPAMVMEKYGAVLDAAMETNALGVAKGVLDRFSDMLDMKPDKVKKEMGLLLTEGSELDSLLLGGNDGEDGDMREVRVLERSLGSEGEEEDGAG